MILLMQMPGSEIMLDSRQQSPERWLGIAVTGVQQWLAHTIMTKLLMTFIGDMNIVDAQSHISQKRHPKMSGQKGNGKVHRRS